MNHLERFSLLPRVGQAIRLLNQHEIKAVVITNQSGVARGYFPESLILLVHQKMQDLLNREGAHLDGIYYCPHHPDAGDPPYRQKCRCRKPATGLVEEAVKALDLDCSRSYVIGDRGVDIEFGHQIGAKRDSGPYRLWEGRMGIFRDRWRVNPDHVAPDLYEAVQWILEQEGFGFK